MLGVQSVCRLHAPSKSDFRSEAVGQHFSIKCRSNHLRGSSNERVTINVRGNRFETYWQTLEFYPDTLLGNAEKRKEFYDHAKRELYFDRSAEIFHNILFYYQSKGILSKPENISDEQFRQELKFYAISHHLSALEDEEWMFDDKSELYTEPTRRNRIWHIVEHPHSSSLAKSFAHFSFCTIVLSIMSYCLETMPAIRYHPSLNTREKLSVGFFIAESVCIVWFSVEYGLRLYSTPWRLKFFRSAMGVIDLLVILPFLVTLAVNSPTPKDVVSLTFLRIIRLVRVLRILKLSRYSRGMKVLGRTVTQSMGQLKALSICLLMAIILSSSAFYYLEGYGKPDSKFTSIPASFWFTIVTMTTVGYGDMVPQTIGGRILTGFCVSSGVIILLCLPTPVFIAHFNKFYKMMSKKAQRSMEKSGRFLQEDGMMYPDQTEVGCRSLVASRQDLQREQEVAFKQQEMKKGFLTPIWIRKTQH